MRLPYLSTNAARNLVGMAVMALSFGIVAALFMVEIPAGNREVALVILGVAIGWCSSVVMFHYGTSEGSKTKTGMISKQGDAP